MKNTNNILFWSDGEPPIKEIVAQIKKNPTYHFYKCYVGDLNDNWGVVAPNKREAIKIFSNYFASWSIHIEKYVEKVS